MKRGVLLAFVATLACTVERRAPDLPVSSAPMVAAVVARDPTVRGARFVPETVDLAGAASDPGGVLRGMVQGVRYTRGSTGAMKTAGERLDEVSSIVGVPARQGGGFLFAVGDTLYRADDWLGAPRPIFRSSRGIGSVDAGLDRMYVRTSAGHVAIDAVSGQLLDLGPWPKDPVVDAMIPLDGWRAVALTGTQGVLATSDAGRTWEKLDIGLRPARIFPVRRDPKSDAWVTLRHVDRGGDADAVIVSDAAFPPSDRRGPNAHCAAVTAALIPLAPSTCDDVRDGDTARVDARTEVAQGTNTALRAAVEDGWPLGNGTAVVAREGALSFVSLEDGSVVRTVAEAYDASVGRCRAVSLGVTSSGEVEPKVGFVCGSADGPTAVFTFDAAAARMRGVRVFGSPRVVQTSRANGWLVRGACDETTTRADVVCVGTPSVSSPGAYRWHSVALEEAPGAPLGLTSDGRVAELVLARGVEGGHIALRGIDGAPTVVAFQPVDRRLAAAMARGVWTSELNELSLGRFWAWLAVDGTVVRVEVGADGVVGVGPFIRDLGSPFVAGSYGLGWTRSRRGYETTDGGQTWTPFVAPNALSASDVRACGPIGCIADGWIRVGWGERTIPNRPPAPMPELRRVSPPPLVLSCRSTDAEDRGRDGRPAPRAAVRDDVKLASFLPPDVGHGDALVSAGLLGGFEPSFRAPVLGRIDAWGPASAAWANRSRWRVRWRSPFAGSSAIASTAPISAPWADLESARGELGLGRFGPLFATTIVTPDSLHALVLLRRIGRAPDLLAVDDGGVATAVTRADGQPWTGITAATRLGTDWFIATPDETHRQDVAIFRATNFLAQKLGVVPRLSSGMGASVKLAHTSTEGVLGVVVDGQLMPDRTVPYRWVVPVDVETGAMGTPEDLGAADFSDRKSLAPCTDSTGLGWVFDTPWLDGTVKLIDASTSESLRLDPIDLRVRVSSERACVEAVAGDAQPIAARGAALSAGAGRPIPVTLSGSVPRGLRCFAGSL